LPAQRWAKRRNAVGTQAHAGLGSGKPMAHGAYRGGL